MNLNKSEIDITALKAFLSKSETFVIAKNKVKIYLFYYYLLFKQEKIII